MQRAIAAPLRLGKVAVDAASLSTAAASATAVEMAMHVAHSHSFSTLAAATPGRSLRSLSSWMPPSARPHLTGVCASPLTATRRSLATHAAKEAVVVDPTVCWRCGHQLPPDEDASTPHSAKAPTPSPDPSPSLFCPGCNSLQPNAVHMPRNNYFHIFNLPLTYPISPAELDGSYKTLQKSLHPDRFHGAAQADQHDIAANMSSYVNAAFATLKSPYERAIYMLSLYGIELGEGTPTITDPALLMEIMETREAVEEMSSVSELTAAAKQNQLDVSRTQQAIGDAFEARDLNAMKQHTTKLSFLNMIEEEIYKRMPVQ